MLCGLPLLGALVKKEGVKVMKEIKTKCIERPSFTEDCFFTQRFDDDECRPVWGNNQARFIEIKNDIVHELFNDPYVCDDSEDSYPRKGTPEQQK